MRIAPPSAFAVWLVTAGTTAVSVTATRAVEINFMEFPSWVQTDQSRTHDCSERMGSGVEIPVRARAFKSTGAAHLGAFSALFDPPSYCKARYVARTWLRRGQIGVGAKREHAATLRKEVEDAFIRRSMQERGPAEALGQGSEHAAWQPNLTSSGRGARGEALTWAD